jgi:hypothetical protein
VVLAVGEGLGVVLAVGEGLGVVLAVGEGLGVVLAVGEGLGIGGVMRGVAGMRIATNSATHAINIKTAMSWWGTFMRPFQ